MTRRDLHRLATAHGWTLIRRARHGDLYRRGDSFVSLASTPGDWRSLRNFRAAILRRTRDS